MSIGQTQIDSTACSGSRPCDCDSYSCMFTEQEAVGMGCAMCHQVVFSCVARVECVFRGQEHSSCSQKGRWRPLGRLGCTNCMFLVYFFDSWVKLFLGGKQRVTVIMATDEKEKDHVKGVWKKTVTITKKILGDRKPIGCYIAGEFPYPIHEVGIMAITYFSRDYNKYQLITIRAPTWKVDLGQVFAQ